MAARSGVTQAYRSAHDRSLNLEQRGAAIDDTRGLAEAYAAFHAGPYGATLGDVGLVIDEIVFATPDRAWVAYRLTRTPYPDQINGEAVLVDGTWRVTRSTMCGELAWAGAPCPG